MGASATPGGGTSAARPGVRERSRVTIVLSIVGVLLLLSGLLGIVVLVAPEVEWGSLGFDLGEAYPLPALSSSGTPSGAGEERMMAGDRLAIPRIGLTVQVGAGDRDAALGVGAWWHAGTAEPSTGGNTVLAGHRIMQVFSRLHYTRPGDLILLRWNSRTFRYRVAKVYIVDPTDIGILAQTPPERLTLYTCIPRIFGNRRTVVVAYPAKQERFAHIGFTTTWYDGQPARDGQPGGTAPILPLAVGNNRQTCLRNDR